MGGSHFAGVAIIVSSSSSSPSFKLILTRAVKYPVSWICSKRWLHAVCASGSIPMTRHILSSTNRSARRPGCIFLPLGTLLLVAASLRSRRDLESSCDIANRASGSCMRFTIFCLRRVAWRQRLVPAVSTYDRPTLVTQLVTATALTTTNASCHREDGNRDAALFSLLINSDDRCVV